MAERRMFAKTIIDSDAFLEMPVTAQLLYFHLSMRADDEGFINKPKSIMRMIGAKDDDINILFARKFVIPFESGIVVIKHWKIHNWIRGDRIVETKYKEEKALLSLDENNSYTMCNNSVYKLSDNCQTSDNKMDAQVRLGKDRLGKDSIERGSKAFHAPTLEEVTAYCDERNNGIDPQHFIDYYSSNGWMVGRTKMKDYKAAIRNWERRETKGTKSVKKEEHDDSFKEWLKEFAKEV